MLGRYGKGGFAFTGLLALLNVYLKHLKSIKGKGKEGREGEKRRCVSLHRH